MIRPTLVAMLAALVFAAPVSARTVLVGPVTQPYQQWVDSSRIATPAARVPFHLRTRPCGYDAPSCSVLSGRRARKVELRPTPGDPTIDRYDLFHELGYVFDRTTMTHRARAAFERLDGFAHWQPWAGVAGDGTGDPLGSPVYDFASEYASCAVDGGMPPLDHWTGAVTPAGTPDRVAQLRMCALLAHPATRRR